jgi:hypothetical protein
MYVVTDKNNVVILNGSQESFRCRQRNRLQDGTKIKPFRFVSYRTMMKTAKKNNQKVYKGFKYQTVAKL